MPPPEPKSSTTSPGFNLARAVGFPQPSEACNASPGTCCICAASYRLEVIGSQVDPFESAVPQQLPLLPRKAACPYFPLTISLMFVLSMPFSYLQISTMSCGFSALFRVQHSEYRNCSSSCNASVFAVYRKNVLSRCTFTSPSFFSL